MTILCRRRRPAVCEPGRASARPGGASAECRIEKNLAARQGRAALSRMPLRCRVAAPAPRAPLADKVTPMAPTRRYQGKDTGLAVGLGQAVDLTGEFVKWNRGTGVEPKRICDKVLISLRNSPSGTVEPWNRTPYTRARRLARVRFHGSTVPEGDIDRGFQSLGAFRERFQSGSTVPANRKRGI